MIQRGQGLTLKRGFKRLGGLFAAIIAVCGSAWAFVYSERTYNQETWAGEDLPSATETERSERGWEAVNHVAAQLKISDDSLSRMSLVDQREAAVRVDDRTTFHTGELPSQSAQDVRIRNAVLGAKFIRGRARERRRAVLANTLELVGVVGGILAALVVTVGLTLRWLVQGFVSSDGPRP